MYFPHVVGRYVLCPTRRYTIYLMHSDAHATEGHHWSEKGNPESDVTVTRYTSLNKTFHILDPLSHLNRLAGPFLHSCLLHIC